MMRSSPAASPTPTTGFGYLKHGFGLIKRPGLRRYAVAPVLVNVVIYAIVFGIGYVMLGGLFDRFLPDTGSWLGGALRMVAWLLVLLVGGAAIFFGFTAIANIVGAPFNSFLSEAVERQLSGQGPPEQTLRDMAATFPKMMMNEARKVLYFAFIGLLVWVIPTLISSIIPGLNVIVGGAVSVLFLAWMHAVEYIDYPMSNRNTAFRTVRQTVAGRRWLCMSFGLAVLVAMAIPLVNLVAMPAAVAGATALWYDHFRNVT